MTVPTVSVVVPAYNEERRLAQSLERIMDHRSCVCSVDEIIVVDDGSRDCTAELVERAQAFDGRVRAVRFTKNRGKGAAVRAGVAASTSDWILVTDTDLSTPLIELDSLVRYGDLGYDVVIGVRRIRHNQPLHRRIVGHGFNLFVRAALGVDFADTQCGFKLYERRAGKDLFSRQHLDSYAFDVEVLLLALGRYRVREVPVFWAHTPLSRVALGRDSVRMFADVLSLRRTRTALEPHGTARLRLTER